MITVQRKANINNLGIVTFNEKYYIVSEWSIHPIESYHTITEAINFIRGFKGLPVSQMSTEYRHGNMMREFIRLDGDDYNKIQDIDSKYGEISKII